MIYLITGVTSFLGLELCNQLLELGHTVYGVCRESSSNCSSLPRTSRFIPIFAQMSEFEHLILPTDIDVFIHLAWAGTNHAGRDLVNIHEQNIAHTFDAMRMAAKFNCKLFIDAGSQAEYGYHPEMITEHSSCNPTSEYGKAKLKVYQAGSLLCKSLGLKYIHLRIFSLIGESDHPWTLVMTAVDRMRKDEPLELSSCEQLWNFLYVKDAAKQIVKLAAKHYDEPKMESEIYHIASQETKQLKEFVERIKLLTNSKSKLHYGAIIPNNKVSLYPSIEKTKEAIGFIADYSFDDVINLIIKTNQNQYD